MMGYVQMSFVLGGWYESVAFKSSHVAPSGSQIEGFQNQDEIVSCNRTRIIKIRP